MCGSTAFVQRSSSASPTALTVSAWKYSRCRKRIWLLSSVPCCLPIWNGVPLSRATGTPSCSDELAFGGLDLGRGRAAGAVGDPDGLRGDREEEEDQADGGGQENGTAPHIPSVYAGP